jgi:pimeloyl-ACP methyl ester carboxylesterase
VIGAADRVTPPVGPRVLLVDASGSGRAGPGSAADPGDMTVLPSERAGAVAVDPGGGVTEIAPARTEPSTELPTRPPRPVHRVRTTDGVPLHVEIHGHHGPVVVLSHGFTVDSDEWSPQIEALTHRARVVTWDQRGHGRSGWGDPANATIDQLGRDLATVVDAVAPCGRVVLGGHSMGGMTVMCLAAARPELFGDRVRGVALVSTSAGDLTSDPRSAPGRMAKLRPGALNVALAGARVVERFRQLLPPAHPRHQKMVRDLLYGSDATEAMVLAGAEIMHASTVRSFISFMPALENHDKRTELAPLDGVPVEIFVGDSDKLTPRRHSRQLAEVLPHARLHEVERTGHMLPQERPQLVVDAIERLLGAATAGRTAA